MFEKMQTKFYKNIHLIQKYSHSGMVKFMDTIFLKII